MFNCVILTYSFGHVCYCLFQTSPDESKFPDINVLHHPSACKPKGPAEPRVFSTVSQTISESILSYIFPSSIHRANRGVFLYELWFHALSLNSLSWTVLPSASNLFICLSYTVYLLILLLVFFLKFVRYLSILM